MDKRRDRRRPALNAGLAIVIPAYNEGENIVPTLLGFKREVRARPLELVVVYDFEEDTTVPVVKRLQAEIPGLKLHRNRLGRGALNAIKAGLQATGAPYVVVAMADGSDDPADVDRMYDAARAGADVVSGSRYMPGGRQLGGPLLKRTLSRAAGLSLHWLAGLPTHDPTNSFRLYSRRLLDSVQIESGGGFEVGLELTVKAHERGLVVAEVPTTWRDRTAGESNFRLWKWAPHYLRWYWRAFAASLGPARAASWRRLLQTGVLALLLMLAAYNAYLLVRVYLANPFHNDLVFDYAAAQIGLHSGWSHIYDLALQKARFEALTPNLTVGVLARYISPPPLAWLLVPFTALPFKVAYQLWLCIELAALAACWLLVAPGSGLTRVIQLAIALALVPVAYEVQLIQPALLVAAACAVSYRLLKSRRPLAAGAVLAVLVLKPQVALLLPLALLLAGHRRAFAGWLAATAPLGAAIAASLGPDGIRRYADLILFAGQVTYNHHLVVAYALAPAVPAFALEALLAGLALHVAWRRRESLETTFAAGLLGSVLASPYLHLGDLVVVLVAAWFFLRAEAGLGARIWLAFGAVAGELAATSTAAPLFVFELGFLALLLEPARLLRQLPASAQWRPAWQRR